MNKDEMKMIEEMAKEVGHAIASAIKDASPRFGWTISYQDVATELYNEGCRKVGDDEIVVKKIKEPFVFYDNREEIEKRMQEYEEEIAQAKQEEVREILTTIYNNLKYATVKQTGTLISIKTLATELGIELE